MSAVAVATHALSSPDPHNPSYIGVPPWRLWLVALPGVMIGSMFGTHVHRCLGTTTVLSLFTTYLVVEFLLGVHSSMAWRGALECAYDAHSGAGPEHGASLSTASSIDESNGDAFRRA